MNTKYTLKNFRVFDKHGATFEMAPLTILTGCNSSGKSSMTKSLMLLSPLMSEYKEDIQAGRFGGFSGTGFSSYNLDFTRGKHKLGSLEKVVNWNSKKNDFSITYSVQSFALGGKVMDVTLTFGKFVNEKSSQTLHAQLQKVEISHDGKIFYQYKCGNPKTNQNEAAHVNLADWKEELINGLQTLELGFITDRIYSDVNAEERGYGYDTVFHWGSLESLKDYYDEETIRFFRIVYGRLNKLVPIQVKNLCQKFNFKNLIIKDEAEGDIDWEKSESGFEFPYNHLYSLGNLTNELNSVSKEDIVNYAEERFVNAEDIKGMWYNTNEYKRWIHYIFTAYVNSDYEKFSDFYSFYENIDLVNEYVYFGTQGGSIRRSSEGVSEFFFYGTACEQDYLSDIRFSFMDKTWEEMTDRDKFNCIFWCLQGFAGYENLACYGGPSPSLPLLDVLREYATLVCAELLVTCDFLTDTDFIEIDRSNAQRIYSFTTQGTDFNQTIDTYYNTEDTIYYAYDQNHLNGKKYIKGTFANKWLKELTGLDGFRLEQAPEGVGYYVFLQKITPSGKSSDVSLADLGYGVTPLLSMLLRIEIMIATHLDKFGYATIFIEEPESNLHPKLQSKLAEIFADAVENYPIHLVLETHSEYLIRKLQVLVANDKIKPETIALHYIYSPDIELRNEDEKDMQQVNRINIQQNGLLSENFGSGFLDEAGNSQLDIIRKARGIE